MAEQTPLALIVEDETDIREVMRITLENDGWRARLAANGREALDYLRNEPAAPDLMLVDLMMPQMSGIELCRQMIDELDLGGLPVLLVSGVNERAQILKDFQSLPLRHHAFLHKPFNSLDLQKAIASLIPAGQPGAAKSAPAPAPAGAKAKATAPNKAKPTATAGNPIAAGTAAKSGAKAGPDFKPTHTGYRLLIVDDQPDICAILETVAALYHKVETASNGAEALRVFDLFEPDIVITDINMPVLDGLEMAAAIRRHPTLCQVPIFFMTGERDTNLQRKVYDVGGNIYLRKPIDPIRLLRYIDYFIGEIGLKSGQHTLASTPGASAAAKPAATAATGGAVPRPPAAAQTYTPTSDALRVLTVDFNPEEHRLLKRLFGGAGDGKARVPGGPFELLWSEDPVTALGNLARWEPDLLLINPRNPNMDGVAMSQTIQVHKNDQVHAQIAFIGTRFYDADIQYSKRHFGLEVIELGNDEERLMRHLGEAVTAARKHLHPKRFALRQIEEEEVERLRRQHASDARQAREREVFRQRYTNIQGYIDQHFTE